MRFVKHLLDAKGRHVISISPDASVLDAIKLMADEGIGSLVVMEGGELRGIVTERDYARKVIIKGRSSQSTPVADIMIAALNKANRPGESIHRAAERERQRFSLWMKRRLWALGTMGALAPFVGLFGTVIGIIRAFRAIAVTGAGGFSVVAEGVSEALVATAGGIGVAILAVAFYNYFQTRGNQTTVEVKLVVDEFLEQLQACLSGEIPPPPQRPSAPAAETSTDAAPAGQVATSEG